MPAAASDGSACCTAARLPADATTPRWPPRVDRSGDPARSSRVSPVPRRVATTRPAVVASPWPPASNATSTAPEPSRQLRRAGSMPYHPATTIGPAAVTLPHSAGSVGSSVMVAKGTLSRLRKYEAAAASSWPGTAGAAPARTIATTVGSAAGTAATPESSVADGGATVSGGKVGTAATSGAPADATGTGLAVAAGRAGGGAALAGGAVATGSAAAGEPV